MLTLSLLLARSFVRSNRRASHFILTFPSDFQIAETITIELAKQMQSATVCNLEIALFAQVRASAREGERERQKKRKNAKEIDAEWHNKMKGSHRDILVCPQRREFLAVPCASERERESERD